MPSSAVKRPRSGPSRVSVRKREAAELERVTVAAAAIPPLSARFAPPRPNRRQRAAQLEAVKQVLPIRGVSLTPAIVAAAATAERAVRFSDLPLSTRTRDGLAASQFFETTDVQRLAIPQALAGRDVLAAAPTGSGKTLSFVVPVLEVLWRNKWSTYDGLGALILAPTRELALQIFEVLRKVARFHMISAGLVIGGKDFEFERNKVGRMNVLVATPGRMLHHMDHVPDLDCTGLQVLVLDEADRILDMGFSKSVDAILQNLPERSRQTLLFSATQTKSVKALARLSLRSPEYVSVIPRQNSIGNLISGKNKRSDSTGKEPELEADFNQTADTSDGNIGGDDNMDEISSADGLGDIKIVGTPQGLSQSFALVDAHEKLSVLWYFIKRNLRSKMIVFFATGKQVRFAFNCFCKLRPGVSLLHIHGNMKQLKRTDMYDAFCRTNHAVLFATDVASRGLDFPEVEWVVQVDCPDDVSAYIHRVGRTARFKSNGRSVLFLCKGNEEIFVKRLETKKLKPHRYSVNFDRITNITPRIAAVVASNQDLKSLAQRAFTLYLKSVLRQSDKDVFDVKSIDHVALANSFGLSTAPKITFLEKTLAPSRAGSSSVLDGKTVFGYQIRDKVEKSPSGREMDSNPRAKAREEAMDLSEDILSVKKVHFLGDCDNNDSESCLATHMEPVLRKRKRIKLDLLKNAPSANRIVFTEDDKAVRAADVNNNEVAVDTNQSVESNSEADEGTEEPGNIDEYAALVAKRLERSRSSDKTREQDRVRSKHAKIRNRLRPTAERDPSTSETKPLNYDSSESEGRSDRESDEFHLALKNIASRAECANSMLSVDSDEEIGDNSGENFCEEEALALKILENRHRD